MVRALREPSVSLLALLLAVALTGCAENFVQSPQSGSTAPAVKLPTPKVVDRFSASGILFQQTVSLQWPAIDGISSWCVSETQTTPPVLACEGGQGPNGGWSDEPPSTFVLSSGPGTKILYTWVRDPSGTLLPSPATNALTLIGGATVLPMSEGTGSALTTLTGALSAFFNSGKAGSWLAAGKIFLDGISAYLDLGSDNPVRFNSSFSALMWVRSVQPGGQILLGRYDPNSTGKAFDFNFTTTGMNFTVFRDGSQDPSKYSSVGVGYTATGFAGVWRQIAGVYESKGEGTSRLSLYIDGKKVAETNSAVGSMNDPNGVPLLVGIAADKVSYPFLGQVGSLALVPGVLPDTAIQALYAAQAPDYHN